MKYTLVAAAALAQGCSLPPVSAEWLPEPAHPELRPYHVEIPKEQLAQACANAPALALHGCAVRVPQERLCIIYTTPNPEKWVMDHERKHCAGWDHS